MRPSSSSSVQGVCRRITLALRSSPRQQSKPAAAQFARQLSNDAKTPQFGGGNSISRTSSLPKLPPSMLRPGESGVQPQEEQEQKQATEDEQSLEPPANEEAIHQLQQAAYSYTGLNFEPPPMPQDKLPRAKYHMRYRYDEGISQLTKLLMRDGKLGKAQNDMAMVLNYLRTSPAPKINPQRPLLPGSPPPEHLPLNPNLYLMLAVDSVAPLVRIRGYTGLAGGGKALEIPVPMSKRARRREAFSWIMDTVNKQPSMGSGKKQLAHRIGHEIVAVVEGKSSVWAKRDVRHKLGTSVRANLNSPALLKRKN